jgi:basic membrane protein A and related proteins
MAAAARDQWEDKLMSNDRRFTRRRFVRGGANIIAAGTALSLLPSFARAAKPVTVGFLYVGPRQDFGWNQAHWVAAQKNGRS